MPARVHKKNCKSEQLIIKHSTTKYSTYGHRGLSCETAETNWKTQSQGRHTGRHGVPREVCLLGHIKKKRGNVRRKVFTPPWEIYSLSKDERGEKPLGDNESQRERETAVRGLPQAVGVRSLRTSDPERALT